MTSIYGGWQATVLKGANGKAVIHKRAKRQSIRLVANRMLCKFGRSELKRVYSDNNHLRSLETFHFDEIIVHC